MLGQLDFSTNATGATDTSMDYPYDVAVDLTTNKVFVANTKYSNPTQVMKRSRAFRRPYPAEALTPRNTPNRIAISEERAIYHKTRCVFTL